MDVQILAFAGPFTLLSSRPPFLHRLGSEEAERAAGDQMTLNVVDVGRRSEYALRYVGARLFCDRGPYSLIGGSRPLEPAVREE